MTALAASAGMVCFGWRTVFQVLLAAGLPLGRLAWGGAHRVLLSNLRASSAISAVLTAVGFLTVTQAGGYVAVLPVRLIVPTLWVLTAIFVVSFFANLFGARGLERLHGVPVTILCFASTAILALQ